MTASELVVSAGPVLLAFQFFWLIGYIYGQHSVPHSTRLLFFVFVFYVQHFVLGHLVQDIDTDNHNLQPTAIFDYVSDIMTSQKYIKGEKRDQACHAKTAFKLAVMRRK